MLTLINIGNNKPLKKKHNLYEIFEDKVLMDQITLGVAIKDNWINDKKARFLLVKDGDENVGTVYFYYKSSALVDVHIAIKRKHQLKHSKDVGHLAIKWFTKHPTIAVLGAKVPHQSLQVVRFITALGFQHILDHEHPHVGIVGLYAKVLVK